MKRLALALVALALLAPGAAPVQGAETRHSVANGCFALEAGSFRSDPYRFQATTLSEYLLYTRDERFLAARGDAAEPVDEPSRAAEWRVEPAGQGFRLVALGDGRALQAGPGGALALGQGTTFRFAEASGCPAYPEVELSLTGDPLTQRFPFGQVRGLLEGHIHMMAFEFLGGSVHCGRPWHKYGAPYALVDCPDHEASGGCGAVLENALYGNPARCHDPVGWPTFKDWPHHNSLTHETTYWRWVERAWRGGLRVYANLFVENRVLCELYPLKRNPCDEMDSVRLQVRRMYELQDYIDAQSGGPGRGFFRVVTDPFQARRVIANGKLAVVLGIEVSELFNCSHWNYQPQCTKDEIDAQLDEIHRYGVRDMELVNKFDNALAGVAGDGGATGPVVNAGNKYGTDTFWDMKTCQVSEEGDKEQPSAPRDLLVGNILAQFLPPGQTPLYGDPPHCNQRGLTELGQYVVRQMMDRKMIIDPDHLSQAARDQVLALAESRKYSGLISSHSWSNESDYPRIYRSGGVVTPSDNDTERFVEDWERLRSQRDPRYLYGIGYGADMNGLSASAGPRGDPDTAVSYPFKSFDGGVTIDRQRSGERVFDINEDGIAHYGLFPDWVEDLRMIAGDQIVDDLANGAEAYLQMWERAEGVPRPRCRSHSGRFRRVGLGLIEAGLPHRKLLRQAGQPQRRDGRVWRYCLQDRRLSGERITAVLTRRGRSAVIASNARRQRAGGFARGTRAARVRDATRPFGRGVRIRRLGKRMSWVYGVRRGRVTFAAAATRQATRNAATLRRLLRTGGLL